MLSAVARLNNNFNNLKISPLLTCIRTATKRAGGGKTNNKDSKGQRLGIKAGEGKFVQPGEVILKQHGTKFFPGENAICGRDHTINATEPGWVRFYRDPFHAERKLVGVCLDKFNKLPTPHFAPRRRRLGRIIIDNKKELRKELSFKPRKQILKESDKDEYKFQLDHNSDKVRMIKNFVKSYKEKYALNDTEANIAANRAYAEYLYLNAPNNYTVKQIQDELTQEWEWSINLAVKRNEISQEIATKKINDRKLLLNTKLKQLEQDRIPKYDESNPKWYQLFAKDLIEEAAKIDIKLRSKSWSSFEQRISSQPGLSDKKKQLVKVKVASFVNAPIPIIKPLKDSEKKKLISSGAAFTKKVYNYSVKDVEERLFLRPSSNAKIN